MYPEFLYNKASGLEAYGLDDVCECLRIRAVAKVG
jgi:hypothetical protein